MQLHAIPIRLSQIGQESTTSTQQRAGFDRMVQQLMPAIEAAPTPDIMTVKVSDAGSLFLEELHDEEQRTGAQIALERTQIIVAAYQECRA